MKLAHGPDEIIDAAIRFRVWDDVVKELETVPKDAEKALKDEGDEIYG